MTALTKQVICDKMQCTAKKHLAETCGPVRKEQHGYRHTEGFDSCWDHAFFNSSKVEL